VSPSSPAQETAPSRRPAARLGVHQTDESLGWWSLEGDVRRGIGQIATWLYRVIALVVLPVIVSLAVMRFPPAARRKLIVAPFLLLGVGVAIVLLEQMPSGPVTVRPGPYHPAHSIGLRYRLLFIGLYIGHALLSTRGGSRPSNGR
jgi:ABC-type amino acid transport system permease subunit